MRTTSPSPPPVSSRESYASWSHFHFLVAPGSNLDFGLDDHHVVLVLEDEQGASGALDFHHSHWSLLGLDPGHGCEYSFSSGLEALNPPLRWITLSNPIVACFPNARLVSLVCLTGTVGTGGILGTVSVWWS